VVAETIALPNIRKFFIPDAGHIIVDADLSGADAQVVAAEAEDERLLEAFREGKSVHVMNVRDVFSHKVKGWSDEAIKATNHSNGIYYNCKRAVHGTNYGGSARAIAAATNWTIFEAEDFQRNWFGAHPGIYNWHRRTEQQLATNRTVSNRFGFRRVYFDRVEGLLPEALAWVPQSTVALVTDTAALRLWEQKRDFVQILMQVHDSLVFQIPMSKRNELPGLLDLMLVEIPYDPPLTIPWGHKSSTVSWGDCE